MKGDKKDGDANSTMIIIAGDVSHDLEILQWTFSTLKMKYGEVAFTVGNHELWLDKKRKTTTLSTKLDSDDSGIKCRTSGKGDGCTTSIEKLEKILQLCVDEDIRVGPVRVGSSNNGSSGQTCLVIPLLSWHHFSFDTEPDISPCHWAGTKI